MTHKEALAIRDQIFAAIRMAGLDTKYLFLTFAGILPITLPDGVRVAILPDIHSPAHNTLVIWAIEQWLAWYKPHIILFMGDVADIFALSRHPKQLRAVSNAQWEIETTKRLMDRIRSAAGTQLVWTFVIVGNHEDRIYRFIQDMAPQLGSIVDPHTREPLSFHSWLGYTDNDRITFLYGTEERGGFEGGLLINNDIGAHHGVFVKPKPGFSPLAAMDRWARSVIQVHTHRIGMVFVEKGMAKKPFPTGVGRAIEFGNLIKPDHAYFAYNHGFANAHPGFGCGETHNGVLHLEPIPIMPMLDPADGRTKLGFVSATQQGTRTFYESDR